MHSRAQASAVPGRVQALLARHNALEKMIVREQGSPAASDSKLRELKRQKLQLKDEIEGIQDVQ